MLKSKNSSKAQPSTLPAEEADIPNQHEESSSSDQESDADVSFHENRLQAPSHFPPKMFIPYIEGSHMALTVNDGLYHRFLKQKLKCKNILQCDLATLPECQKCKKVVAWTGDFGMDQYVSLSLPKEDLSLDTIWEHFEEFCKPQVNEVRAHFDLLTALGKVQEALMNGTIWSKHRSIWPDNPRKQPIYYIGISFGFFLKDEEFVSKKINEGSVDLGNLSASEVCQLAKKMESPKTTARHNKQVAGDPQAAQINLICHQCTELSNGKYKEKKSSAQQKQVQHKNVEQRPPK